MAYEEYEPGQEPGAGGGWGGYGMEEAPGEEDYYGGWGGCILEQARRWGMGGRRGPQLGKPYGAPWTAWYETVRSKFDDEEAFQNWVASGQTLQQYQGGARFGKGLAEQMGLQYGVGYDLDRMEGWFNALRSYDGYKMNNPMFGRGYLLPSNQEQFYVRGAQMGMRPEDFISVGQDIEKGLEGRTPETDYIYGLTDTPPPGYVSVPPGRGLGFPGGGGEAAPPRQAERPASVEWFRQQYPSIEIPKEKIRVPSGRWAPRIKTIGF